MRSKFKFGAYFVAVLAIVFTGLLCLSLSVYFLGIIVPVAAYIVFNLYFIFVWLWLVWGELRTKTIVVDVGYDSLSVKRYLGLGVSTTYYFNDIDGYKTAILPAKGTSYEFLYLMGGDKKLIKLSQFYHKNYKELKTGISSSQIKYLGDEDFSYLRELKEIFI